MDIFSLYDNLQPSSKMLLNYMIQNDFDMMYIVITSTPSALEDLLPIHHDCVVYFASQPNQGVYLSGANIPYKNPWFQSVLDAWSKNDHQLGFKLLSDVEPVDETAVSWLLRIKDELGKNN